MRPRKRGLKCLRPREDIQRQRAEILNAVERHQVSVMLVSLESRSVRHRSLPAVIGIIDGE